MAENKKRRNRDKFVACFLWHIILEQHALFYYRRCPATALLWCGMGQVRGQPIQLIALTHTG